ncbi:unnamed protein product [Darwinula stevensoni]|uniref:Magnesium transporter protein 1 n=1 Tax=Darwinula stevensoni TaxID=69355 RepID=A0A7R9A030_9CRUS|nr:unnamed protein product [Darwinula stevensoni]CAG0880144.1 unnamed protein product [Darwinula stevensoni]
MKSLGERVQQLTENAMKKSITRMNKEKFMLYAKSVPRNYSLVVMFTALSSKRQCAICRQAFDEFQIVANSFRYSQSFSNKLFFGLVDFDEASDVFQYMKVNAAPQIMHFPGKGKQKKGDVMDFGMYGLSAEAVAKWILERTEIQIRVFRPPNYSGSIAILILFVLVAGLLYLRRNNLDFLANKTMWGLACLGFMFAMISGQMWNHIRSPPFIHRNHQGNFGYIYGSSQGQLVLETYIVIGIYAAIVFGMILMIESGSNTSKTDVGKKKLQAVIGLALMAFFFSLLLSIFRSKSGGYPYSFLLK